MPPKKAVERDTLDLIVKNIQDAHAATNALFDTKLEGVARSLNEIRDAFGTRITQVEKDHEKVARKVAWILGVFAAVDVLLGIAAVTSHR